MISENSILNLSEGKNLDVLVLRNVMTDNWFKNMYSDIEYETSPNYSKDFSKTLDIIEKLMSNMMIVKFECVPLTNGKVFDCTVSKEGNDLAVVVMQPSIQVAVCKAAVIAMSKINVPIN